MYFIVVISLSLVSALVFLCTVSSNIKVFIWKHLNLRSFIHLSHICKQFIYLERDGTPKHCFCILPHSFYDQNYYHPQWQPYLTRPKRKTIWFRQTSGSNKHVDAHCHYVSQFNWRNCNVHNIVIILSQAYKKYPVDVMYACNYVYSYTSHTWSYYRLSMSWLLFSVVNSKLFFKPRLIHVAQISTKDQ